MRVLYVEDDETLAKAVERMLEMEGHECDRAETGREAVRLGQTNKYDVILLDIMLPDFDGYEVVHKLHEKGVRTPFLIQSGLVERDNARAGAGFGVENYLIKPFNREELISRLDQAVSRAAKKGEAANERRKDKRVADTETASILFDYGKIVDCTIFSRSEGGAAIEVANDNLRWMKFFTLKTGTGKELRCETCWQFRNKVGVKFV